MASSFKFVIREVRVLGFKIFSDMIISFAFVVNQ